MHQGTDPEFSLFRHKKGDGDRFVFPFHEIFKTIGLGCSIFLVRQNAQCVIFVINTK